MPFENPGDAEIAAILSRTRTIAVVGASPEPTRPSYPVVRYLIRKGYEVFPVNPNAIGQAIDGRPFVASLRDIRGRIDMVDVFRRPDAVLPVAREAIAVGARALWLQLGVIAPRAAEEAQAAGLAVVMDRCPKIELGRLNGEIAAMGVNAGILSARRRRR